MKNDFTELNKVFGGMLPVEQYPGRNRPEYKHLYVVETVSTFRHVYFVRANSSDEACEKVENGSADIYLQKHIAENAYAITDQLHDESVLAFLNTTEHEDLTMEEYTKSITWPDVGLDRLINE